MTKRIDPSIDRRTVSKYKDYSGLRFSNLEVLSFSHFVTQPCGLTEAVWECKCDCGKIIQARRSYLKSGSLKSCGCLRRGKIKHGAWAKGASPKLRHLYLCWKGMKARCSNPLATGYENYGGRGISYDQKWEYFESFKLDMEHGCEINLELDRIDNDGNYTKSNCRWVSGLVQANNKRTNVTTNFNGEIKTVAQLARRLKISWWRTKKMYALS
jgi:hypothetical protein